MQSHEVYRLLTRRIRRGMIIWPVLGFAFCVIAGLAFYIPGGPPWAVSSMLAGFIFLLGAHHVRKRREAAWKVSGHPELVYWAHPMRINGQRSDESIHGCRLLLLHLRDGTHLEVNGLTAEKMSALVGWLRERNPSIRLGAYD